MHNPYCTQDDPCLSCLGYAALLRLSGRDSSEDFPGPGELGIDQHRELREDLRWDWEEDDR